MVFFFAIPSVAIDLYAMLLCALTVKHFLHLSRASSGCERLVGGGFPCSLASLEKGWALLATSLGPAWLYKAQTLAWFV